MLLENFYQSFLIWVELKLSTRFWLWKIVLLSVAVALFIAFPPYTLLLDHFRQGGTKLDAWVFIQNQSENLFHPKGMEYDVRRENMIFRWLLPLLSFLTGHNVLLILLLQAVLAVFFLFKLGKYIFALSGDKITTAFFVLSVANIFVSVWSFADIHGYGDGFAYFFLLAALLSKNPFIIFISLQAAFFTDERAVVAGGYLLLWWIVVKGWENNDFDFKSIVKNAFTGESGVVWIAWIIYFAIREYVQLTYFPNHSYSTIGTPVLFANAHRNGLGSSIWGAFEGTWLLFLAAALLLCITKRYLLFFALCVGFAVLVATGIYVHDIDRALSYGFPFLLISMFVLLKSESLNTVRLLLFFTMVICVSHPQVFYMGYNRILWLEPLPFKMFMYLGQVLGWNTFH